MATSYLMGSFFIFLFGLCIGSFLNFIIYRISLTNFSFWKDIVVAQRSYCPHCKHELLWQDLIPIASFLFLKGECRYCHKKISLQYPLVEILTGLVFLSVFSSQYPIFNMAGLISLSFLFYIASTLIVIFVYDLKYYLILDMVLFPAIIITFAYRLIFSMAAMPNYLLAVVIAAGFFLGLFLVSKGQWIGFGDVKLVVLLGLILGFPNVLAGLFLSFFFGAIIGVVLMLLNKKGLKSEVPFAPFLIAGTFMALFWGPEMIDWYTHFLIF